MVESSFFKQYIEDVQLKAIRHIEDDYQKLNNFDVFQDLDYQTNLTTCRGIRIVWVLKSR